MVHGQGIAPLLRSICAADGPAHAFCCQVANPTDYGIAEVSETGSVISLEEKPERPKSKLAVIGLYFLDGRAPSIAKSLVPSARGETEIVDLLGDYLQRGELSMSVLGRGTSWMDMGTPQMLLNAANYVHALESRQRLKIGCIEEIAWRNGWIDDGELKALGERARGTAYGDYLVSLPTDR